MGDSQNLFYQKYGFICETANYVQFYSSTVVKQNILKLFNYSIEKKKWAEQAWNISHHRMSYDRISIHDT